MAKDKGKEATPKFNFEGTIAQSKYRIVGVPVHTGDKKAEPNLEELLEKTEKDEVLSARKDNIVAKLKKQAEPNPKRWTVNPETGKIDVDEEGGEYTQKEAMIVSASIKGKSGQYDAAIALITAAKALVSDNQPNVAEKPKEFYVDPETGVIIHDSENGEYTLSEARTISQSLQKGKQAAQDPQGQKSFLERVDEVTNGLVTKRIAGMLGWDSQAQPKDPVDEIINRKDQMDKLRQAFGNSGGGGAQDLAKSGIRGELLKLLLEDERDRLKMKYEHENQVERNKHLGGLATVVKENLADGIQALRAAANEIKAGVSSPAKQEEAQPQSFVCSCGMKFSEPAGWAGQPLQCPNPNCGREYTKEQLLA